MRHARYDPVILNAKKFFSSESIDKSKDKVFDLEEDPSASWFQDDNFLKSDLAFKSKLNVTKPAIPEYPHTLDIQSVVDFITEQKAQNIKVIDMRERSGWCKYFIISEGLGERHINSIASSVYRMANSFSKKNVFFDGNASDDWKIVNIDNDIVVHVFTNEARKIYNLEGIWEDE
jgi:ribosome-associated protein